METYFASRRQDGGRLVRMVEGFDPGEPPLTQLNAFQDYLAMMLAGCTKYVWRQSLFDGPSRHDQDGGRIEVGCVFNLQPEPRPTYLSSAFPIALAGPDDDDNCKPEEEPEWAYDVEHW
jgi:hypothetical protein